MEFVSKNLEQLKDLFRQMTPAARITTGLLIVVVIVSLVYLFRLQTSGNHEYVLGGREFSQQELGTMAAAFSSDGLEDWEIVGFRMRIPRSNHAAYLKSLKDHDAMPRSYDSIQKVEPSFLDNSKDRATRAKLQKQVKLSKIVEDMVGIETATVELSESKSSGFPRETIKSALVAVKPAGTRSLESHEIDAIQDAISHAESGLEPRNVAVLDMVGKKTHVRSEAGTGGSGKNIYAQHKQQFESLWKRKILDSLTRYDGVVVGVNVELSEDLRRQESQKKYDTKPVTVNSVEVLRTSNAANRERGGRPGPRSNAGNSNQAAVIVESTGTRGIMEESENRNYSLPGTTETVTEKVGLIPKQVSATIGIPSSYYEKVWRKNHPAPDGQPPRAPDPDELAEIERETIDSVTKSVETLLMGASTSEKPIVTVRTDQDGLPVEKMPKPSFAEVAAGWLGGQWQTLALLLLAGAGLILLRRSLRQTNVPQETPVETSLPAASVAHTTEQDGHERETHTKLKRKSGTAGPDLRDELKDLVAEDPDAAANVLRNWIGDAA